MFKGRIALKRGENWFLGMVDGEKNLTVFNEQNSAIHMLHKQINSISVVFKCPRGGRLGK